MALACPALVLCVYFLQTFYLRTSRQMRFLDLECKSPLYTHFTETIEGLSTIRAFGWEGHFLRENIELLDKSQRPNYLMYCIQRWFNLVLLLLVGFTAVIVVALATSLTSTTTGGRLGVSLSSVVNFNFSLGMFMMFWTQMETSLGAIARLKSFEKETVSEHKEEETFIPGEKWPSSGNIEFKNVSASYGYVVLLFVSLNEADLCKQRVSSTSRHFVQHQTRRENRHLRPYRQASPPTLIAVRELTSRAVARVPYSPYFSELST